MIPIIRINVSPVKIIGHQYSADVWRDDELILTRYGASKAEAVAGARTGYSIWLATRPSSPMVKHVANMDMGETQINEELWNGPTQEEVLEYLSDEAVVEDGFDIR